MVEHKHLLEEVAGTGLGLVVTGIEDLGLHDTEALAIAVRLGEMGIEASMENLDQPEISESTVGDEVCSSGTGRDYWNCLHRKEC